MKFTIPGNPVSKPRMTQSDRWKKRPAVMRYRAWADLARLSCIPLPADGNKLRVRAFFEIPKSKLASKFMGTPHFTKPDSDNVLKAVMDALWPDGDSMIWYVSLSKYYDDGNGPRIELEIE